MDLEKLLTQSVITVFTVIFIFIMCWTKNKIEKRFRKHSENIKQSKVRMKKVSYQESVLCKKVLCESTNRHQRSIIASSLMHTLDEELQRLQQISDSIRRVQVFPKMMPNFQHMDASFLNDFGASTQVFNKDEECLVECENKKFRKDHKPLQSKLYETWRDHARKQLKTERKYIGSRHCKKNDIMYKSKKTTIFQTTKTMPQNKYAKNLTVCNCNAESQQNTEMIKNANSRFQIKKHKITKKKRLQEILFNPLFKRNHIISTSDCETSNINLIDSSKKSCVDFKFTPTDERYQIKRRSSYTCPSDCQHAGGIRKHSDWLDEDSNSNSANTPVEKLDEQSEISLDESKTKYKFKNTQKNVSKCTFELDLICRYKDLITNGRIAKNIKNPGIIMENKIKVGTKCLLGKNGFSICIFKIPIKMQKQEIIMKFIFCVILKDKRVKRKKYYCQSNVNNVKPILSLNNLTKMQSKCTIQRRNKLEHKKLLSKKHTIYTNSDQCPKKIENDETFLNLDSFMTFTDGDTALPFPATTSSIANPMPSVTERNKPNSWLYFTSANQNNLDESVVLQQRMDLTRVNLNKCAVTRFEGWSDFESENNLGSNYNYIVQHCIELTEDCLKDSSMVSFDYGSLLAYDIKNDKTVLTTIEEEPVEDTYDLNENTNRGKLKNSMTNSKNISICTENKNLKICTTDLMNCSKNVTTCSDLTNFSRNLKCANSERYLPDEFETDLQLLNYNKDSYALNCDENKNEHNEEVPQNLVAIDISTELESNEEELRLLEYVFEIKHFGESNNSNTLTKEDYNSFHEISTQLVTSNYQMRQLFFRNDNSTCSISEHSWQSDILRINNNPSTWTFKEVKIEEIILEGIRSQNYLVLNESHVRVQSSDIQFDTTFYNSSSTLMLEAKLFASADHGLVTDLSCMKTKKVKAKEELKYFKTNEDDKR